MSAGAQGTVETSRLLIHDRQVDSNGGRVLKGARSPGLADRARETSRT